jgi:hypothetical protein
MPCCGNKGSIFTYHLLLLQFYIQLSKSQLFALSEVLTFICITKTTCYAGGSKKLSAVSKIKTSNDILMLGLATEHISKEASIDE